MAKLRKSSRPTISVGSDPGSVLVAGAATPSDIDQLTTQIRDGFTSGVSADLDDVDLEIRISREMYADMMSWFEDAGPEEDGEDDAEPELDEDEEGRVTVARIGAADELLVFTRAVIRAATIVDIPAFRDAQIHLTDVDPETGLQGWEGPLIIEGVPTGDGRMVERGALSWVTPMPIRYAAEDWGAHAGAINVGRIDEVWRDGDEVWGRGVLGVGVEAAEPLALAAASSPGLPPQHWFEDPGLTGPTPITITEDGHVYGHFALWGTCHTGYAGQCVTPPRSPSNGAYFTTGVVETDGGPVAVGRMTADAPHANRRLSATDASAHYEHTALQAALVTYGEDQWGAWVSGMLSPTITDEQLVTFQASPPSGDWRMIGGRMELLGVHAVNDPGFPVPRALVAGGQVVSLQVTTPELAGMESGPDLFAGLSPEDSAIMRELVAEERARREDRAARALHARFRMSVASARDRVFGVS